MSDRRFDREFLEEAVNEYVSHQSWRCDYPDRYPHDPDCPCGLVDFLRRVEETGAEVRHSGPRPVAK